MARPKDSTPHPAPKIAATKTRPAELSKGAEHEEKMMDEALDESFPASDPAAIVNPGSSVAVKHAAQDGRKTPEPSARKK